MAGLPNTPVRPYTHPKYVEGRSAAQIDESSVVPERTRPRRFRSLQYVDDKAEEVEEGSESGESPK